MPPRRRRRTTTRRVPTAGPPEPPIAPSAPSSPFDTGDQHTESSPPTGAFQVLPRTSDTVTVLLPGFCCQTATVRLTPLPELGYPVAASCAWGVPYVSRSGEAAHARSGSGNAICFCAAQPKRRMRGPKVPWGPSARPTDHTAPCPGPVRAAAFGSGPRRPPAVRRARRATARSRRGSPVRGRAEECCRAGPTSASGLQRPRQAHPTGRPPARADRAEIGHLAQPARLTRAREGGVPAPRRAVPAVQHRARPSAACSYPVAHASAGPRAARSDTVTGGAAAGTDSADQTGVTAEAGVTPRPVTPSRHRRSGRRSGRPSAGHVGSCAQAEVGAVRSDTGSRRTTMPFDVGWLLMSATLSSGTSTLVSG
ncbi:hypothetical protein M2164_000859 [Streptomyces sp. SAI-208]|nr:hypothetical protein [Streptomyces sp. SAI-133]MDH6605224.1 hypothetical protein [Streptomyces sp. SAI-208]